jgi:hypothetical protein
MSVVSTLDIADLTAAEYRKVMGEHLGGDRHVSGRATAYQTPEGALRA